MTRDVPSDGNCLFHALQRELRPDAKTGRPGLLQPGMDCGTDGQALRGWLMRYLQALPDEVEGQPLQTWLGMPLAEYVREMRLPSSRSAASTPSTPFCKGPAQDARRWGGSKQR